jgi:hypothetical protein
MHFMLTTLPSSTPLPIITPHALTAATPGWCPTFYLTALNSGNLIAWYWTYTHFTLFINSFSPLMMVIALWNFSMWLKHSYISYPSNLQTLLGLVLGKTLIGHFLACIPSCLLFTWVFWRNWWLRHQGICAILPYKKTITLPFFCLFDSLEV